MNRDYSSLEERLRPARERLASIKRDESTSPGFYYIQMQHELDAAEKAREEEKKSSQLSLLGAGVGYSYGGPAGAFLGASIGSYVSSGCIIITACTSPESYEVNIAREYRDTILDRVTLGGYYALCEIIVPWIHKSRTFKRFTKRLLVDRLIDYAEIVLNYKNRTKFRTSEPITKAVLSLCHVIGLHINTEAWITLHT